MATIVTRSGKGSPLTNAEVDANFTNLNDEAATKAPLASPTLTGTVNIEGTSPAIQFAETDTTDIDGRLRLQGGDLLFETVTNGGTLVRENVRITDAGNVGIGTSAPTQSLEVAGSIQSTVNGTSSILALSGDNTNYSALRLRQSSTVSRLENLIAGTGAYTPIAINAGGSERMRVTTAGSVGIGTTSPAATLDVAGTGAVKVPVGTAAERPTAATGMFRFNTDLGKFEGYTGTLWGSVGGGATGGGADEVFVENDQTVTTNYTIPANKNAMSTGPVTVNAGVTVTVSAGARYVVI